MLFLKDWNLYQWCGDIKRGLLFGCFGGTKQVPVLTSDHKVRFPLWDSVNLHLWLCLKTVGDVCQCALGSTSFHTMSGLKLNFWLSHFVCWTCYNWNLETLEQGWMCCFQELHSAFGKIEMQQLAIEELQEEHEKFQSWKKRMAEEFKGFRQSKRKQVKTIEVKLAKEKRKIKRIKIQLARERSQRKRVERELTRAKSKEKKMEKRNNKVIKLLVIVISLALYPPRVMAISKSIVISIISRGEYKN